MKLRPRNKQPANDSITVPATVPVLPPDTTRLQTPPLSERSNAGSTTVRKEHPSDFSSSVVDESDTEARLESMSLATKGRRLTITVPAAGAGAAPLTKNNLEKLSEEITSSSAVEEMIHGSEGLFSSPTTTTTTPSPRTRLVQAKNFLRAERPDDTGPGFATRLERIDGYLRGIPRGVHSSIYHEVQALLRAHQSHIRAGERRRPTPRTRPPGTPKRASRRPPKKADDDDDQITDPNDHAHDPLEWTNKITALVATVRRDPAAHTPSAVLSRLRHLARPLNHGRFPSADDARRLIAARLGEEAERARTKDGDIERLWTSDDDDGFPPDEEDDDGWEGVERMQLGRGSMMPVELREWDWDRDRRVVMHHRRHDHDDDDDDDGDDDEEVYEEEEEEVGEGEGEGEEKVEVGEGEGAQLLLAETPFLQWLMGEQIRGDLEDGELVLVLVVCFFPFGGWGVSF